MSVSHRRIDVFAAHSTRLVAGLGLLAAIGLPTMANAANLNETSPTAETPSSCAVQLSVDNPAPGTGLSGGAYQISGMAKDEQGNTIQQVQAFLGDRDLGGTELGTAVPQTTSPLDMYTLTAVLPSSVTGGQTLFVYALASNGQESVVQVPFALNLDPSQVGMSPSTSEATISCPEMSGAATTPASQPAEQPTSSQPAAAPAATTASAQPETTTIHLNVANPSPGDVVPMGAYEVSGTAWDTAATSGPGVDTVSFFLDSRDQGGMALGTAEVGQDVPEGAAPGSFQTTLHFPATPTGGHTLYVYAHSTVTGDEAVVTIPLAANNT